MSNLTKEECLSAKNRLRGLAYSSCDCKEENIYEVNERDNVLEQLIYEHFDNPPLKFEEFESLLWKPIYDKFKKQWYLLISRGTVKHNKKVVKKVLSFREIGGNYLDVEFEENRFFLKEVKDDE
ncbi:MAG: hypothetical protein RR585_01830 [Coprobacillus sp.]